MNDLPSNPRERIGDNQAPDYAKITVDELESTYAETKRVVSGMLDEAHDLPEKIDGDETKGKYTSLIKRFRDMTKRLDALRESEKQPHFRRAQGVDQFFFGLLDKCARRDKKAKPGAADVLQFRLTEYDTMILQREQERRRREAAEAERIAREKREAEEKALREAEEARLAAERARKPEKIEEKTTVADVKEEEATIARVESTLAQGAAEQARIDTLAKPADIMRRRGDDGTLSTMATEPFAEIVDESLLNRNVLWPFISLDAKEKALRAWARTTGHTVMMDGAAIGKRPKSVVR